jgi:hypothetical protein
MSHIDQPKVNKAVRDCLQHCYNMPGNMLPRLAEFLGWLRASGGWREVELREVEAGVRKTLLGILGDANPEIATDTSASESAPDGSKSPNTNGA